MPGHKGLGGVVIFVIKFYFIERQSFAGYSPKYMGL